MGRMLRQGESSCWPGSLRRKRDSRGRTRRERWTKKDIFWQVVNRITESGPYWAIYWAMQRVSNSHVKKKTNETAHYAWNPKNGMIEQPSPIWNAIALRSPPLFTQQIRQMEALNDCEQGWVSKKWLKLWDVKSGGTVQPRKSNETCGGLNCLNFHHSS